MNFDLYLDVDLRVISIAPVRHCPLWNAVVDATKLRGDFSLPGFLVAINSMKLQFSLNFGEVSP